MGWTGQGIIYGEVNSCTDEVLVGRKNRTHANIVQFILTNPVGTMR